MEDHLEKEIDLLLRAKQFDSQALAQIYDLFSPGIYRYAARLLGDRDLAEDCVSETFGRFLQTLKNNRGPKEYLQAYLYRLAHNLIVDHFRRSTSPADELGENQLDGKPGPEQKTLDHLKLEHLRSAMRKLTLSQQQVIALKYLEEWNNEDIARAIGKPIGAVKSLQHRALAALQRILRQEEQA
jgi:RNA polymerase sigma-70 factor (ECF subfamily)